MPATSLAQWWQRFNDPQLTRLVTLALQANTSLRSAQAALQQARAQVDVQAAGLLPSVGANRHLRRQLNAACAQQKVRVHYPELHLCTDNGAMIAMAAAMRLQAGQQKANRDYAFDVKPRWPLHALAAS